MSLYLGSEELSLAFRNYSNILKGTVESDENGVVTFGSLPFTPSLIAIWNIKQIDLKEGLGEDEEWDEEWIRYTYEGIALFAFYHEGIWFSQCYQGASGETYLSQASITYGSCVEINNGIYSYRIQRQPPADVGTNETFNYLICG